MKNCFKLLVITLSLWTASLSAAYYPPVQTSLTYGEIGLGPFPLPLPVFGLGYRAQYGHHGFDCSVKVSTVVDVTQLKGSLLQHFYFRPDICSQSYIGAGASVGALFGDHTNCLISPEFVFGKQYMNEFGGLRFFQAALSFPTVCLNKHEKHDVFYMPLVVLSYGVIF